MLDKKNPFDDIAIAANYEQWYLGEGLYADKEEKNVLAWVLKKFSDPKTMLEVGCGTGHFSRWFETLNLMVTPLDISMNMIKEARNENHLNYLVGDAVGLPFSANSFDVVTFITTLEFLTNPILAIEEAIRVAKKGIVFGLINRNSRLGRQYKKINGPIWKFATLFTPNEIIDLCSSISNRPITAWYRTTLWPFWKGMIPFPWGGFIGLGVSWEAEGGS